MCDPAPYARTRVCVMRKNKKDGGFFACVRSMGVIVIPITPPPAPCPVPRRFKKEKALAFGRKVSRETSAETLVLTALWCFAL